MNITPILNFITVLMFSGMVFSNDNLSPISGLYISVGIVCCLINLLFNSSLVIGESGSTINKEQIAALKFIVQKSEELEAGHERIVKLKDELIDLLKAKNDNLETILRGSEWVGGRRVD